MTVLAFFLSGAKYMDTPCSGKIQLSQQEKKFFFFPLMISDHKRKVKRDFFNVIGLKYCKPLPLKGVVSERLIKVRRKESIPKT